MSTPTKPQPIVTTPNLEDLDKAPSPSDGRMLNNAQAAHYLGVSPGLLRLSRCTGELFKGRPTPPFTKYGRSVRYFREDLEAWLNELPRFRNTAQIPPDT